MPTTQQELADARSLVNRLLLVVAEHERLAPGPFGHLLRAQLRGAEMLLDAMGAPRSRS